MKKRVLSMLLAIVMVLGLFPALTPHAHAKEEHICADNNGDHRCDLCGYCMGDHVFNGYYNPGDATGHYPECQNCPYGIPEDRSPHTYEGGRYSYNDAEGHYPMCDLCIYYDESVEKSPHTFDGENDYICNTCGYNRCPGHNYVWDEETLDAVGHLLVCSACGDGTWEAHFDEDANVRCDICGFCMNGEHSYDWDGENWDSWKHRLVCKNCGLDGGWEAHYDGEDDDELCDVCDYGTHRHTFEKGQYAADSGHHYAMCDVCGEWGSGEGYDYGPHEDEDSDCICDVCGYSLHRLDDVKDLGDGTHKGPCTVCGESVILPHAYDSRDWDEDGHWYVCACGAVDEDIGKTAHFYEASNWYIDSELHYPECDVCGYHKPEGGAHDISEGSGGCGVCGICGHTVHSYEWDGKEWDNEDHWVVCSSCGEEGWEDHYDGTDADELCDACSFNLACPHEDTEEMYDDNAHWDACTACRQSIFSPEFHSFDYENYHEESDKHYPKCDDCDYYKEAEGEDHVDEGEDGYCDVCDFWIHEHTYEYEYWTHDDGKHYLVCDLCDKYDRTTGEACTDTDNDHRCDVCRTHLEDLCYDKNNDTDGNHRCDVCRYPMTDLCDDIDNDHVCDAAACQRHMKELCSAHDENSDWLCDICGKNFCNHYFDNEPLTNNNGTHKLLCRYCGEVTEDCYADWYDYDETMHAAFCRCGYEFSVGEHTYADGYWVSRNVAGHWAECDGCYQTKWVEHTASTGTCGVCELELTTVYDVYVGGMGLVDGQYLDNAGTVSVTKPEGGYAYYEDGVLELNGYVYDGPGFLWSEYESGEPDWAALYATKDLTLVLKGENSLQITRPDAAQYERNYSDGIAAEKDLTIRGDGSLSIQVNDDGVQTSSGDVTIEGGTLTVNAEDHGFDVIGSVTVTGGTVDVTAGDEGFNVDEDITISGGEILIDAADIGLDASGFVTISGGTVEVTAKDDDGIQASESVRISGGTITIDAAYCGIFAYEGADISGGDLVIHSERDSAIHADGGSVTISGGNLDLTSGSDTVVAAYEDIFVEGYAQLPEGVVIEEDEAYGRWFITVADGHLSIVTPFSAELKEDGIHLTGSPWSLKVVFAAYNSDGKMLGIHVVEEPGNVVPVPDLDGTVIAFFLNSRSMPVHASLPIE